MLTKQFIVVILILVYLSLYLDQNEGYRFTKKHKDKNEENEHKDGEKKHGKHLFRRKKHDQHKDKESNDKKDEKDNKDRELKEQNDNKEHNRKKKDEEKESKDEKPHGKKPFNKGKHKGSNEENDKSLGKKPFHNNKNDNSTEENYDDDKKSNGKYNIHKKKDNNSTDDDEGSKKRFEKGRNQTEKHLPKYDKNKGTCYSKLGCFALDDVDFNDIINYYQIPMLPLSPDRLNVTFRLFNEETEFSDPIVFKWDFDIELMKKNFNKDGHTIFIIHGFQDGYKKGNWNAVSLIKY